MHASTYLLLGLLLAGPSFVHIAGKCPSSYVCVYPRVVATIGLDMVLKEKTTYVGRRGRASVSICRMSSSRPAASVGNGKSRTVYARVCLAI
jgi:hypothetical protein